MAGSRQVQIDAADGVSALLRATVKAHPSPPRPTSVRAIVPAMYKGKILKVLLLAGVAATSLAITFFQGGSEVAGLVLRVILGLAVVVALVGPGRHVLTVARFGRNGLLAGATVTDAEIGVDESKRPEASGRRVVRHPLLGDFDDEFLLVAPWAGSVDRGTTLQVLVAPDRRKTWVTLGLDEPTLTTELQDSAERGAYLAAGRTAPVADEE